MREIRVKIEDEDLEDLKGFLENYDLTPSQLLQGFIGDLIESNMSNGSDERDLANSYFNRAYGWLHHSPYLHRKRGE